LKSPRFGVFPQDLPRDLYWLITEETSETENPHYSNPAEFQLVANIIC
jgi:hypothetical protein